ncbi:MAG TPA: ABC transporter substrate-binding protein, partial [Candidatus Thermoplasmatota archaeon]|nr:ABC transporter substrate-binding protein [Candidatus Thermoplasmatota archaeon]
MRTRLTIFTILVLVAAPLLAGCASNNTTTTPTGTATPTGGTTTPTTTATPTPTATPIIPTTIPKVLNLNLKMGLMMPISGDLADLGADMRDSAKMAIDEINAANVGLTITLVGVQDDGTGDSAGAPGKFNQLVGQGATAVVGPCCSGVTAAVLTPAVDNEIVVASPSATSPALTLERDNDGYFWRVSPSDAVQGKVLADLVKQDGSTSATLLIINNPYGNGLAGVFSERFTAGGGSVVKTEKFAETANEFSAGVTSVCATNAQALVIVAYIAQGANIVKELNKQGCLGKFKVYGSEGIYKGNGPEGLPERAGQDSSGRWLASGIRGTTPESGNLSAFNAKFKAKYGQDSGLYSAESYDGVMYIALAALAAESVEGAKIKDKLLSVANGGYKTSDFRTAALLILGGQDVDWQGQAHDFDYDERHEPKTGVYSWWEVGDDGQVTTVATGKSA